MPKASCILPNLVYIYSRLVKSNEVQVHQFMRPSVHTFNRKSSWNSISFVTLVPGILVLTADVVKHLSYIWPSLNSSFCASYCQCFSAVFYVKTSCNVSLTYILGRLSSACHGRHCQMHLLLKYYEQYFWRTPCLEGSSSIWFYIQCNWQW